MNAMGSDMASLLRDLRLKEGSPINIVTYGPKQMFSMVVTVLADGKEKIFTVIDDGEKSEKRYVLSDLSGNPQLELKYVLEEKRKGGRGERHWVVHPKVYSLQ